MSKIDFEFIARNPPALLIAGGILFLLLNNSSLGIFLILLGIGLQIYYLYQRYG